MADRYHADDLAIFDAGDSPRHSWEATLYPGQFYDTSIAVTELLLQVEGLAFRLQNFDPQTESKMEFPLCRVVLAYDSGILSPSFYFPTEVAVKRSKFHLQLSTAASGVLVDIFLAVKDYVINDDDTIVFECEHPLSEWRQMKVSEKNAETGLSNLIPNS